MFEICLSAAAGRCGDSAIPFGMFLLMVACLCRLGICYRLGLV